MARLREREVDNKVQVTDSEVDLFLEQMKARPRGAEYNIAHILVRVPEQASPERIRAARSRAERRSPRRAAARDFARVAASYSDAPDALQGGALGWRSHGAPARALRRRAGELQPGEVTRRSCAARRGSTS